MNLIQDINDALTESNVSNPVVVLTTVDHIVKELSPAHAGNLCQNDELAVIEWAAGESNIDIEIVAGDQDIPEEPSPEFSGEVEEARYGVRRCA